MRLSDDSIEKDAIAKDVAPSVPMSGMDAREQTGSSADTRQSRLISKVLSPALRLWVRSQLDHVEDLHLDIEAGDRQLLSGSIQQVSASARKGVYRGLHLSQISLLGQQIQTNLGQVLRGKAFRLLTAFPVMGTVAVSEADLNASLTAPLLADAIAEFLLSFLMQGQGSSVWTDATSQEASIQNLQVQLGEGELTATGILTLTDLQTHPVTIQTGLRIQDGNLLVLERFQCQVNNAASVLPPSLPDRWVFDLGSEVWLEELQINPAQIHCRGRIMVQP